MACKFWQSYNEIMGNLWPLWLWFLSNLHSRVNLPFPWEIQPWFDHQIQQDHYLTLILSYTNHLQKGWFPSWGHYHSQSFLLFPGRSKSSAVCVLCTAPHFPRAGHPGSVAVQDRTARLKPSFAASMEETSVDVTGGAVEPAKGSGNVRVSVLQHDQHSTKLTSFDLLFEYEFFQVHHSTMGLSPKNRWSSTIKSPRKHGHIQRTSSAKGLALGLGI